MEQARYELLPGGQGVGPAESNPFAAVERLEHDLNDVLGALKQLGMGRCSQCKKFFKTADSGSLFDNGEPVCFACIPAWWAAQSKRLTPGDREKVAGKLAMWLRKHHRAVVVKDSNGKIQGPALSEFQMSVKCQECSGSGKLLEGERCRFCVGIGEVRVVVPK